MTARLTLRTMSGYVACKMTRLTEWREARSLTKRDLADLTGYSESTFSLIESGKRRLSLEAKVTIARRLGVPIRELFEVDNG